MNEVLFTVTRSIEKTKVEKWCPHYRVEVDEQTRTIHCRDCNCVIDPFNYVLGWAMDQNRYTMEVDYKKRELAKLYTEMNELKKTISYLKRKGKDPKVKEITQDER